jgi:hypothetical protein
MPHELYDETDDVDHPVLVVSIDTVTRTARVVTRTSKFEARGPKPVAHPPQPDLQLERPGWWRLHRQHPVPWVNFADPDVESLGKIDESTWTKITAALTGTGGAP